MAGEYRHLSSSGDDSYDNETPPPPPPPPNEVEVTADMHFMHKEPEKSTPAAAKKKKSLLVWIAGILFLVVAIIVVTVGVTLVRKDDNDNISASAGSSMIRGSNTTNDNDSPSNNDSYDGFTNTVNDADTEIVPGDDASATTSTPTSTTGTTESGSTTNTPQSSKRAPNVIFVVLDDLGYADVGFTQDDSNGDGLAEVKTPNIDALAREGVIFTNGYSSGEVCAPTRAGYMLGRYQQGVGIYSAKSGGGDGMEILRHDPESDKYININPWIGQFLKQEEAGGDTYVTGAFGKWHLGVDDVFAADADGIYRYKSMEDTEYSESKDRVAFPINGPVTLVDGMTPITEGIPEIYSSIAPLGQAGSPYHPLYRGFDSNHIFMGRGSKDFWDPNDFYVSMDPSKPSIGKSAGMDPRLNPGNSQNPNSDSEPTDSWDTEAEEYIIHHERTPSTYATTNFTKAAIDFIRSNAGGSQPFFAYVPYSAPHFPAQAPYHMDPATGKLDRMGEDVRRYAGMTREEFAASGIEDQWFEPDYEGEWFPDPLFIYEMYNDNVTGFTNMYVESGECCTDTDIRRRAITTAMNRWVDKGIGQIVSALKDPNGDGDISDSVYEDTMILFISDNGGAGKMRASNKPLRGGKFYMWEGGHRVPFFMAWGRYLTNVDGKGTDKRGTTSDVPVTSLDILPTILDANGINDISKNPLLESSPSDGKSLLPILDGSTTNLHDYLFWARERSGNKYEGAVRKGAWKLIIDRKDGPGLELFDLDNDLGETNNIVEKHADIVNELKEVFIEWMNEVAKRNGESVPNYRLSTMF